MRRLATQFGAVLPFGQAAATLDDAAAIVLSASTLRVVTEAVGQQRECELREAVTRAWRDGVSPAAAPAPVRL